MKANTKSCSASHILPNAHPAISALLRLMGAENMYLP
ncbi:MAG: hypothetical protein ACI8Z9_002579 [Paraglaciecola sp.]|jgi:hypothetical protein